MHIFSSSLNFLIDTAKLLLLFQKKNAQMQEEGVIWQYINGLNMHGYVHGR